MTSKVIDQEGVHSPRHSPHCKRRRLLSNAQEEASARFFCNAGEVLCIHTPAFSLFIPRKKKKAKPAVKWCNPDAVTMLLSVNHQRHHFFFKGKEKVGAIDKLKVVFLHAVEFRSECTAVYDV